MRGLRIIETRRARALRRDAAGAERILWKRLQNRRLGGFKFVRQAPIGPFIADFVCRERKVIIELDRNPFDRRRDRARQVADYLQEQNYRVIRFVNAEVYENVEAVAEAILSALIETAR